MILMLHKKNKLTEMLRIACLICYLDEVERCSYNQAAIIMGKHRDYKVTKAMLQKYDIFVTTPNTVTINQEYIIANYHAMAKNIVQSHLELASFLGLKQSNVLPVHFVDFMQKNCKIST